MILPLLTCVALQGSPTVQEPLEVPHLVWPTPAKTDHLGLLSQVGTLTVEEVRGDPASRHLTIPVKRFKATGEKPLAPIFFLSGGPGQSNQTYAPPADLLLRHDVVLVGYRGVDGSTRLDCPEVEVALDSSDGDLLSEGSRALLAQAGADCAARLTKQGIDLAGYTMTAVVDDLNEARALMGYEQLNLLSASYGTRVAQIYAARHRSSLKRSLMIGVNAPGGMLSEVSTTDDIFAIWNKICAEDPACSARTKDLAQTVREALENMPYEVNGTEIDPGKVRVAAICMLAQVDTARQVLKTFVDASDSNYRGLAGLCLAYDRLIPTMMVWGDLFAKGCTSGDFDVEAPDFDPPGSVLGSPMAALFFDAAKAWPAPRVAEEYQRVAPCDVPTLLLGGELDTSTPPARARELLLPSLSQGQELTIPNLGHVADILHIHPDTCTALMVRFFATGEVLRDFPTQRPSFPGW